jgi:hypothetical protein
MFRCKQQPEGVESRQAGVQMFSFDHRRARSDVTPADAPFATDLRAADWIHGHVEPESGRGPTRRNGSEHERAARAGALSDGQRSLFNRAVRLLRGLKNSMFARHVSNWRLDGMQCRRNWSRCACGMVSRSPRACTPGCAVNGSSCEDFKPGSPPWSPSFGAWTR